MTQRLRDRDPIHRAWRVAAIYRCVLAFDKDIHWARAKLNELDPSGYYDHFPDIWFAGIEMARCTHRKKQRGRSIATSNFEVDVLSASDVVDEGDLDFEMSLAS